MAAPKVFVVGGTGAQGMPVVRGLVKDKAYNCRVLTRNLKSARAQALLALGNVELLEGSYASEIDLRKGFAGCAYAFVNIDGFNSGEKTEMFWAFRSYELAIEAGIKFFVYGNLDYGYKLGGFDPKYRCGHYDGKGRVGEWILSQTKQEEVVMGAALFTTGPYIEMVLGARTVMAPVIESDGTVVWRVPLGRGEVPHVTVEDCEHYVRWLFDHRKEANGMDLQVAIAHIGYDELAAAFTKVTGKPARYEDIELETFWKITGDLGVDVDQPSGYNATKGDPATMTFRQNFTGWWNLWKDCHGEQGLVKRDYALLDRIHPNRVKSAEEWFRKEEKRGIEAGLGDLYQRAGDLQPVLKIAEDRWQGRL